MDERYARIVRVVVEPFAAQLGPRLRSAFVKGSVARGDAVWGVSDLDLVLAFDTPTPADTALKRETTAAARALPGGEALVIQRIWEDRLQEMSPGVRAYWLWSCRHEAALVHGEPPGAWLPAPPPGRGLARLLAPIIRADGEPLAVRPALDRQGSRQLSKRLLQGLALPALALGEADHVPPLGVPSLDLPAEVRAHLPGVLAAYGEAPALTDASALRAAWAVGWVFVDSVLAGEG